MSEEYGSDFFTVTDEEGEEYELEHLDTVEHEGNSYLAFLPADMDEDDEDYGLIIMKQVTADGESWLEIPPDDELDAVYELFMKRLFDDEDENTQEDDNIF